MEINMDTEYNNLLESLEDIVGQMQMEKLTFEQALNTLRTITKYYENRQGE
jgi:exonuclease VII small subunit